MKLFKFAVATLTLLAAQNLFADGTCAQRDNSDRHDRPVASKSTKTSEAPVANLPTPKGDGAR